MAGHAWLGTIRKIDLPLMRSALAGYAEGVAHDYSK